jgi:hypothetical protein
MGGKEENISLKVRNCHPTRVPQVQRRKAGHSLTLCLVQGAQLGTVGTLQHRGMPAIYGWVMIHN